MSFDLDDEVDKPRTRVGRYFGAVAKDTHTDDDDGPGGDIPYDQEYASRGSGGSVLEDPTSVNEYPLGRKERPRPRLRQLPVRRSRAKKGEADGVVEALDLGPLQLLPPHIANALSPSQEHWLAARLLTYNDKQVCLNLGMSYHTLKRWKVEDDNFREAYDFVTLSLPELGLQLNGLLLTKSFVQLFQLLDHPNLSIRLRAIDIIHKRQAAAEQAAAKRESMPTRNTVNLIGAEAFEWARKKLEGGWGVSALPVQESSVVRPGDVPALPAGPDQRARSLLDLLDSESGTPGTGEVLPHPGRE